MCLNSRIHRCHTTLHPGPLGHKLKWCILVLVCDVTLPLLELDHAWRRLRGWLPLVVVLFDHCSSACTHNYGSALRAHRRKTVK